MRLASESPSRATILYRVDVELRDALRPEIEAVEVALRTRYHAVMSASRPESPVWLLDPQLPARAILAKGWPKAFEAVTSGRLSADAVVDQLSLRFWGRLTSARHEQAMWVPYLRRAFAGSPSRHHVHEVVETIVRLRNRVQHYNTVVELPVRDCLGLIFWLLERLEPDLARERRNHAHMFALLAQLERKA
jgi:hypothetical protein